MGNIFMKSRLHVSACGHPRNPVFLPHGRFNVPWTSAEILFSLSLNYRPMNGGGSGTAWCKCNAALSLHTLVHKQNKEVIWDITGKKLRKKKMFHVCTQEMMMIVSQWDEATNINLRNKWNCRKCVRIKNENRSDLTILSCNLFKGDPCWPGVELYHFASPLRNGCFN